MPTPTEKEIDINRILDTTMSRVAHEGHDDPKNTLERVRLLASIKSDVEAAKQREIEDAFRNGVKNKEDSANTLKDKRSNFQRSKHRRPMSQGNHDSVLEEDREMEAFYEHYHSDASKGLHAKTATHAAHAGFSTGHAEALEMIQDKNNIRLHTPNFTSKTKENTSSMKLSTRGNGVHEKHNITFEGSDGVRMTKVDTPDSLIASFKDRYNRAINKTCVIVESSTATRTLSSKERLKQKNMYSSLLFKELRRFFTKDKARALVPLGVGVGTSILPRVIPTDPCSGGDLSGNIVSSVGAYTALMGHIREFKWADRFEAELRNINDTDLRILSGCMISIAQAGGHGVSATCACCGKGFVVNLHNRDGVLEEALQNALTVAQVTLPDSGRAKGRVVFKALKRN